MRVTTTRDCVFSLRGGTRRAAGEFRAIVAAASTAHRGRRHESHTEHQLPSGSHAINASFGISGESRRVAPEVPEVVGNAHEQAKNTNPSKPIIWLILLHCL